VVDSCGSGTIIERASYLPSPVAGRREGGAPTTRSSQMEISSGRYVFLCVHSWTPHPHGVPVGPLQYIHDLVHAGAAIVTQSRNSAMSAGSQPSDQAGLLQDPTSDRSRNTLYEGDMRRHPPLPPPPPPPLSQPHPPPPPPPPDGRFPPLKRLMDLGAWGLRHRTRSGRFAASAPHQRADP